MANLGQEVWSSIHCLYLQSQKREFRDHQKFQRFSSLYGCLRQQIVDLFTFFEREIQNIRKDSVIWGI